MDSPNELIQADTINSLQITFELPPSNFDRSRSIYFRIRSDTKVTYSQSFQLTIQSSHFLSGCGLFYKSSSTNSPEKVIWTDPRMTTFSLQKDGAPMTNVTPRTFSDQSVQKYFFLSDVAIVDSVIDIELTLYGCNLINEADMIKFSINGAVTEPSLQSENVFFSPTFITKPSTSTALLSATLTKQNPTNHWPTFSSMSSIDTVSTNPNPMYFLPGDSILFDLESVLAGFGVGTGYYNGGEVSSMDESPISGVRFHKPVFFDEVQFKYIAGNLRYRTHFSGVQTRIEYAAPSQFPDHVPFLVKCTSIIQQDPYAPYHSHDVLVVTSTTYIALGSTVLTTFVLSSSFISPVIFVFKSDRIRLQLSLPLSVLPAGSTIREMYVIQRFPTGPSTVQFLKHISIAWDEISYSPTAASIDAEIVNRPDEIFAHNMVPASQGKVQFSITVSIPGASCQARPTIPESPVYGVSSISSYLSTPLSEGSTQYSQEWSHFRVESSAICSSPIVDPVYSVFALKITSRVVNVLKSPLITDRTLEIDLTFRIDARFLNIAPFDSNLMNKAVFTRSQDPAFVAVNRSLYQYCDVCFSSVDYRCHHLVSKQRRTVDETFTMDPHQIIFSLPDIHLYFSSPDYDGKPLNFNGFSVTCRLRGTETELMSLYPPDKLLPLKDLLPMAALVDVNAQSHQSQSVILRESVEFSASGFTVSIEDVFPNSLPSVESSPLVIDRTRQHVLFTIRHDTLSDLPATHNPMNLFKTSTSLKLEIFGENLDKVMIFTSLTQLGTEFPHQHIQEKMVCQVLDVQNIHRAYVEVTLEHTTSSAIFIFNALPHESPSWFSFPLSRNLSSDKALEIKIQCGFSFPSTSGNVFDFDSKFMITKSTKNLPVAIYFYRQPESYDFLINTKESQDLVLTGLGLFSTIKYPMTLSSMTSRVRYSLNQVSSVDPEVGTHPTDDVLNDLTVVIDLFSTIPFSLVSLQNDIDVKILIDTSMYIPSKLRTQYIDTQTPIPIGTVRVKYVNFRILGYDSLPVVAKLIFINSEPWLTFSLKTSIVFPRQPPRRLSSLPLNAYPFDLSLAWFPDFSLITTSPVSSQIFFYSSKSFGFTDNQILRDIKLSIPDIDVHDHATTFQHDITPSPSQAGNVRFTMLKMYPGIGGGSPSYLVDVFIDELTFIDMSGHIDLMSVTYSAAFAERDVFTFTTQKISWQLSNVDVEADPSSFKGGGTATPVETPSCTQCIRIKLDEITQTASWALEDMLFQSRLDKLYSLRFQLLVSSVGVGSVFKDNKYHVLNYVVLRPSSLLRLTTAKQTELRPFLIDNSNEPVSHAFLYRNPYYFGVEFPPSGFFAEGNSELKLDFSDTQVVLLETFSCAIVFTPTNFTRDQLQDMSTDKSKHANVHISYEGTAVSFVLQNAHQTLRNLGFFVVCAEFYLTNTTSGTLKYSLKSNDTFFKENEPYTILTSGNSFPKDESEGISLLAIHPYGNYLMSPMTFEVKYPRANVVIDPTEWIHLNIYMPDLHCVTHNTISQSKLEIILLQHGGTRYSVMVNVSTDLCQTQLASSNGKFLFLVSEQVASLPIIKQMDTLIFRLINWTYHYLPLPPSSGYTLNPIKAVVVLLGKQNTYISTFKTLLIDLPVARVAAPDDAGASVSLSMQTLHSSYPIMGSMAAFVYSIPLNYMDYTPTWRYSLSLSPPQGFILNQGTFVQPPTSGSVSKIECSLYFGLRIMKTFNANASVSGSTNTELVALLPPLTMPSLAPLSTEKVSLQCRVFGFISSHYNYPSKVSSITLAYSNPATASPIPIAQYSSVDFPNKSQNFSVPRVSIPSSQAVVSFSPASIAVPTSIIITVEYMPTYLVPGDIFVIPFPSSHRAIHAIGLQCHVFLGYRDSGIFQYPSSDWLASGEVSAISGGSQTLIVTLSRDTSQTSVPEPSLARGTLKNASWTGLQIKCDNLNFPLVSSPSMSSGMKLTAFSSNNPDTDQWVLPDFYRVADSVIWNASGQIRFGGLYSGTFHSLDVSFSKLTTNSVEKDHDAVQALDLGSITFLMTQFSIADRTTPNWKNIHFTVELPNGFRTRRYTTSYSSATDCTYELEKNGSASGTSPAHLYVTSKNPLERFPSHHLRVDLGDFDDFCSPEMGCVFTITCTGFGIPVYAPPSSRDVTISIRTGGGTVASGSVNVLGSVLSTGIFGFHKGYTVTSGSSSAIARFSPAIANTVSIFILTMNPIRIVDEKLIVVFNLPIGTRAIPNSVLRVQVVARNPMKGTEITLETDVMFTESPPNGIPLLDILIVNDRNQLSPQDIVEFRCFGLISPLLAIPSKIIDLEFSINRGAGFVALQSGIVFEGIASRSNALSLKRLLLDPVQGTFSIYTSELVDGIPPLGGKFAFSLPELVEFVTHDLVNCFFRRHDGDSFTNEIFEDDIPATSIRIDDFSPVSRYPDELDIDIGDDSMTQTLRHRVTVYFDEDVVTALADSPYGYVIQCRGATPKDMELLSSDSYYIQIFERLTDDASQPDLKRYGSLASTSSATLVSTNAPLLAMSTTFLQSSYDSGGIGEVEVMVRVLSLDLYPSDVIEIRFPASYQYEFNIPSQGKKIPVESSHESDQQIPITTCALFPILRSEEGEETLGEMIDPTTFVSTISSISLYQSTITAASASQSLSGPQPTILSLRFSPSTETDTDTDTDTPAVALFEVGDSFMLKCNNVGYPVNELNNLQFQEGMMSISLYRSLQEVVSQSSGAENRDMMVDTLLVRRAFNDNVIMPLLGPQKLKSVRFFTASPRFGVETSVSIEMELTRSLTLTDEKPVLSIHTEIPGAWRLSHSTQCTLSLGSAYFEDATITGTTIATLSSDTPSTELYIDSLTFSFAPPNKALRQAERLHLFCSPVKMPERNILDVESEEVLTSFEVNSVSYITPQADLNMVYAQNTRSVCPVVSSLSGPSLVTILTITQQFTSHQPFTQTHAEIWRDLMEKQTLLFGLKTLGIRSIHQEQDSLSSKSKEYYRITLMIDIHTPQPWFRIEDIANTLQRKENLDRINKTFATHYNAGPFQQIFSWSSTISTCYNDQNDAELGETDIDCGGDQCIPCTIGQTCERDNDCWSRHCNFGVCVDSSFAISSSVTFVFLISIVSIVLLLF